VGLQVFKSESGAKTRLAFTLLSLGWQLQYASKANYIPKSLDIVRSTLKGLETDRSKLDAAGVHGVYVSPAQGYMDWDQLEEFVRGNLARVQASQEKSTAQ
jgi:hypothetical protein